MTARTMTAEKIIFARRLRYSMLPFVLYFVTAVVTGFHVYMLLSFVVYGVPINALELFALLGSFCLLIAAYLSLFRPRAAASPGTARLSCDVVLLRSCDCERLSGHIYINLPQRRNSNLRAWRM